MGKAIGYARVSTEDQNLSLQEDELKKAGCTKIFKDKISGAKTERKELSQCLKALESGDTLIVWRIDRLGRSLQHLVEVVTDLRERGVKFKSLKDGAIDTTSASGELIFNIFACLAQFERRLIQERTRAGLNAARARGKKGGRKPMTINDSKVDRANRMYQNLNFSINDICDTLNISRATFYRYLKIGTGSAQKAI
jgi:DNA invertase Pin-like site-specific DNA recombinase